MWNMRAILLQLAGQETSTSKYKRNIVSSKRNKLNKCEHWNLKWYFRGNLLKSINLYKFFTIKIYEINIWWDMKIIFISHFQLIKLSNSRQMVIYLELNWNNICMHHKSTKCNLWAMTNVIKSCFFNRSLLCLSLSSKI